MDIKVEQYRSFEKYEDSKVKGVARISIMIDNHSLNIDGIKVIIGESNKMFYALPTREGKDEAGEKKYYPICAFFTKDGYSAFHSALTVAFKEYFAKETKKPPKEDPKRTEHYSSSLPPLEDDNIPF